MTDARPAPSLVTEHRIDCDVLVAGGGPAGTCCALAAARCGADVVLCQDRPMFGGNASSEVRMHIVGADCSGKRGLALATEAREGGLIEEIRLGNAAHNPQLSASMLDLTLYDLVRRQPGLTALLNTTVTAVSKAGRRITHALAERPGTEDRFVIRAKVFVDCTGDGRVGAEAGAAFRHGRESVEMFGESLAQSLPDEQTLGSTIMFVARKHDRPMPFQAPPWARAFTEDELRLRPHASPDKGDLGLDYGFWWAEWGGRIDTIKDNEAIRDELLAIVLGAWDHLKNGGDHGADNWALDWFGFVPGKRESRRFIGQYILNQADVQRARWCDDAIAFGGWFIDTHPPGGVDAPGEPPCDQNWVDHLYNIPLRCCISRDVPNLLLAGRDISSTHVGFASTRVMATCAVIGQGVGTSAAYAAAHGVDPADLPADSAAMAAIQQRLLRDDAYLVGHRNADPADLARHAAVSASSAQADGPAELVVSGQTRAVSGDCGAPEGQRLDGPQRWMAEPGSLPQWIELRWDKPITPRRVHLVFDTGMHRVLTLSPAGGLQGRMQWGRPQDETVRDYDLLVADGKGWRTVLEVRGNYQRLRVHELPDPAPTDALRVLVHATNGLDHARICEARVYDALPAWPEPDELGNTLRVVDEPGVSDALDAEICRCLNDAFGRGPDDAKTRSWHGSSPAYSVIVEKGGRVIAHVGVHDRVVRADGRQVRVAGVLNVAVDPAHRGAGLAPRCMAAAMRQAELRGYDAGLLFCVEPLIKFYRACGWETIRPRHIWRTDENGDRVGLPPKNDAMFYPLRLDALAVGEIDLQGNDW